MELIALWKMFLRRWWLIVLPAIAALALTLPEVLQTPATGWTTSVTLTAAQPPDSDEATYEDSSFTPWTASEYLVNALADWVRTTTFAEEVSAAVAETAGYEIDPGAIRGSVAADNTRSVMRVYLSWGDAEQLEALARAAVDVLQTRNQDYFPQLSAEPAQVIALDDIHLAPVGPGLLDRLRPLIKVALALAAGVALAAVVEYLDDSIYGRGDLEDLEWAVLAEIPRHKGSSRL